MKVTANKKGVWVDGHFSSKEMGLELVEARGGAVTLFNARGQIASGVIEQVNGKKAKTPKQAIDAIVKAVYSLI